MQAYFLVKMGDLQLGILHKVLCKIRIIRQNLGGKNSKIENWACDENCALHTKIVHTLGHLLAISKRLRYSQNYLRIFLAKNLSKKDKSLAKNTPIFDSYKMF